MGSPEPVPYVDERAAEELFRHKVLGMLRRRGLLSRERIEFLLSWRRSFSVNSGCPDRLVPFSPRTGAHAPG